MKVRRIAGYGILVGIVGLAATLFAFTWGWTDFFMVAGLSAIGASLVVLALWLIENDGDKS